MTTTLHVHTPLPYTKNLNVAEVIAYLRNANKKNTFNYGFGPDKMPATLVLDSLVEEDMLMNILRTAHGIQIFLPSEDAWNSQGLQQRAYADAIENIPHKTRMGTAINTNRTFDDFQVSDETYTAQTLAPGVSITLSFGRMSVLQKGPNNVYYTTGKWKPSNMVWIHGEKENPEDNRKNGKVIMSSWDATNGIVHIMNGVF